MDLNIMAVLHVTPAMAKSNTKTRTSVSCRVLTNNQMANLIGGVGSNPGQPPPGHKKKNGSGNGNGNGN